MACMHCEKPICCEVCPTHARAKRPDGVVLIDQVNASAAATANGLAIRGSSVRRLRRQMTGCNFCEDLLAQGKNPAASTRV